ncbi:hypothetical protein BC827DRAFT_1285408 [Russula dissimulans]|nr:hypothetical protein BC827DRAFT_1285408 [Russula dissimulans]
MGGFMEYDGNQPIRVLFPDELQSYSLTGNGDFPKISKAEIKDKSKGDAISKAVIILQTGWFVTQCVARVGQRIVISELELVTVAFAALNFVIYLLWWHKPLNVQRGVRVYRQRTTEQLIDDGDVEADVGYWGPLFEALSKVPAAIADGPMTRNFPRVPWLHRVSFWPFFKLSQILGIGKPEQEYTRLKKVNTFYPDSWPTERTMLVGLAFVGVIALAFGGIHFLVFPWLVVFPSYTTVTFWVVTSVSIVVVPITLFLSFVIRLNWKRHAPGPSPYLFDAILGSQLGIYIFCRLTLLILPFVTLTSLSVTAYYDVHWTSSIPHI